MIMIIAMIIIIVVLFVVIVVGSVVVLVVVVHLFTQQSNPKVVGSKTFANRSKQISDTSYQMIKDAIQDCKWTIEVDASKVKDYQGKTQGGLMPELKEEMQKQYFALGKAKTMLTKGISTAEGLIDNDDDNNEFFKAKFEEATKLKNDLVKTYNRLDHVIELGCDTDESPVTTNLLKQLCKSNKLLLNTALNVGKTMQEQIRKAQMELEDADI